MPILIHNLCRYVTFNPIKWKLLVDCMSMFMHRHFMNLRSVLYAAKVRYMFRITWHNWLSGIQWNHMKLKSYVPIQFPFINKETWYHVVLPCSINISKSTIWIQLFEHQNTIVTCCSFIVTEKNFRLRVLVLS